MQIRWSVQNERVVLRRMERLANPAEVNAVVRAALNEASDKTAEWARQMCPVDTGALRSTIRKIPTVLIRNRVKTGVQAGGPSGSGAPISPGVSPKTGRVAPDNVTYDRYVHDDLDAHHDVGEAKFIEKAMILAKPYTYDLVHRAITRFVRRRR